MNMVVFLIGFMGSGKSTIGKKLAKTLNYNFLDLDQIIEQQTSQSIANLFETKGEHYFRQLENDWLKNVNVQDTVIALGGGTPCFNDNMALINSKGHSVYVQLSVKILASRLAQAKTIRPIIEPYKSDLERLTIEVETLLTERLPYYELAHLTFESSDMSAEKYSVLSDAILDLVR